MLKHLSQDWPPHLEASALPARLHPRVGRALGATVAQGPQLQGGRQELRQEGLHRCEGEGDTRGRSPGSEAGGSQGRRAQRSESTDLFLLDASGLYQQVIGLVKRHPLSGQDQRGMQVSRHLARPRHRLTQPRASRKETEHHTKRPQPQRQPLASSGLGRCGCCCRCPAQQGGSARPVGWAPRQARPWPGCPASDRPGTLSCPSIMPMLRAEPPKGQRREGAGGRGTGHADGADETPCGPMRIT